MKLIVKNFSVASSMLIRLVISCVLLIASANSLQAAVILSLTANGDSNITVGPPSSSVVIDVYLRQGSGTDFIQGAFANFDFGAGTLISNSGVFAPTGVDNGGGYFGAGNLLVSTLELQTSNSLEINQELQTATPAPATAQKWFSVQLNTTGLNEGTYNISLRSNPTGTFYTSVGGVIPVQSALSFTVTAIPEPASSALLLAASAIGLRFHRRRASRKPTR